MENLIKQYEQLRIKMLSYRFASFVISWDAQTEAPKGAIPSRAEFLSVLSGESYKLTTAKETTDLVDSLFARKAELDSVLAHEITLFKERTEKLKKIPMDEYISHMKVLATSSHIWAKAKNEDDWDSFKPVLEEIVTYKRKYIKYLETKKMSGYDVLLNDFERDMTIKDYDKFFNTIKTDLVPFVKEVLKKDLVYNDAFEKELFPIDKQREFSNYLMDVFCFDKNHGLIKESDHPFTSGMNSRDVRFTTHYYEDKPASAMFSTIHELGHAIYEQQIDPALDFTFSGGGASMALHESQSRFYENIIGRSKEFWKEHFPILKNTFKKELKGVRVDDFYKSINKVSASLIRIEADELTYPIHIMIRYDIEKALFNNEIEVADLPNVWKKLVKEYLDIDVPNNRLGVLQDTHWSGGMFGYFPTYALGSAYASQMFNVMRRDFPVMKSLKNKNTKEINEWFKENLHVYGSTKYPKEIFKLCTKQNFNPKHYVNYLIKKYAKLYDIK